MIRSIRHVATSLIVAFFIVSLGLLYWQVIHGPALAADPTYAAARQQQQAISVNRGRIVDRNGVVLAETTTVDQRPVRHYPYPALAHVVGYTDPRYGAAGLESVYDEFLRGARSPDPFISLLQLLAGRSNYGSDVVSTVDLTVQRQADEALGEGFGAAIAFDVRTGEILALASHPYYDPNELAAAFEELSNDPDAPLLDRATQGIYPPGSTFKLVTLASALENGVVRRDTIFSDPDNGIEVDGNFIADPNHPDFTEFDTLRALAFSSNSAFAEIGLSLGGKRLEETARRFGFGAELIFELPTSISRLATTPGLLETNIGAASTAIGQGELQVTPLQMAYVVGAVANGGDLPALRLVRVIQSPTGIVVEPPRLAAPGRVMSAETAATIRDGMVLAVDEGGVPALAIEGVPVAAKSGTAEVGEAKPHAWLIAFAPADRPRVAVVVMLENIGGGNRFAGPAARQILEAALAATAETP